MHEVRHTFRKQQKKGTKTETEEKAETEKIAELKKPDKYVIRRNAPTSCVSKL